MWRVGEQGENANKLLDIYVHYGKKVFNISNELLIH